MLCYLTTHLLRQHLTGIAIQWGAVGDVGVVLEHLGGNDIVVGGTLPQRLPSCIKVLDGMLQRNHPIVASFVRYVSQLAVYVNLPKRNNVRSALLNLDLMTGKRYVTQI